MSYSIFDQLNTIPTTTPKPQRASRKREKGEVEYTETDKMFFDTLVGLGGTADTVVIGRKVPYCGSNTLKYMRRLEAFGKVTSKEITIRETKIRSKKIEWTVKAETLSQG
jgi:hypothetical protein